MSRQLQRAKWCAHLLLIAFSPLTLAGPVPGLELRWPIQGSDYEQLGQDYGQFESVIAGHYHTGLDIEVPEETSVVAAAAGTVRVYLLSENQDRTHCLGNVVVIDHGSSATLYAHLRADVRVHSGNDVEPGDELGFSSNTTGLRADLDQDVACRSVPYHLHFELKDQAVLGSGQTPDAWGYTPDYPDEWGFHDPVTNLQDRLLQPSASSQVTVTSDGIGARLRTGPDTRFRGLGSVLTESEASYRLILDHAAGTSNCSMGWYQIARIDGSYFPDLVSGGSLPEAWVCKGNDGVSWLEPASNDVLSASLTATPNPVAPGDQLSQQAVVRNLSESVALSSVQVELLVPEHMDSFPASALAGGATCPGGDCDPGELASWTADLEPGAIAQFEMTTILSLSSPADDGTEIPLSLTVTADGGESASVAQSVLVTAVNGGSLINDGIVAGTISQLGERDEFTFAVNAGESLHIRVVDTSDSYFAPEVFLYNPDGTLNDARQDGVAVAFDCRPSSSNCQMSQSGTYRLVVGDDGDGYTGNYQIHYKRVSHSNENGSLVNDSTVSENLSLGDIDSFVFTANAGDAAHIRIVDTADSYLTPEVYLYNPDGTLVSVREELRAVAFDCRPSSSVCQLNQTGTYRLVVADDGDDYPGNYQVQFKRVPDSNENGSLVNDAVVMGNLSLGDIDSFVFTANAGEAAHIRIVDVDDGYLTPEVYLYNPDGTLVSVREDLRAVAFDCRPASSVCQLNQTGTYRLVVADDGDDYPGNYEIHFARVPLSNENGSLINDGTVSGNLSLGDIDSFVFTANAGEAVHIRIVDTIDGYLTPEVYLYNPDGTLVSVREDLRAVAFDCRPASSVCQLNQTGTYRLVVADDGDDYTGDYEIHFKRVLQSNENGSLVNDATVSGALTLGDIDSFVFEANAGEAAHIRIVDTIDGYLTPEVYLYNPDGTLVSVREDLRAVAFDCRPASSVCQLNQTGTYRLVVADDGDDYTGDYEIHFKRVLQSNENGSLVNDATVPGVLTLGDIDSFVFAASSGDSAVIRVTDTSDSNFSPEVHLYNPDGSLARLRSDVLTVEFDCGPLSSDCQLNQTGIYRLVVSDDGDDYPGSYEIGLTGLIQSLPDADGDGVPDVTDNCPGVVNPGQGDLDGDGAGDACDEDDDGDGVSDLLDDFPRDPSEWVDSDGDGIGDNADPDDDSDGWSDAELHAIALRYVPVLRLSNPGDIGVDLSAIAGCPTYNGVSPTDYSVPETGTARDFMPMSVNALTTHPDEDRRPSVHSESVEYPLNSVGIDYLAVYNAPDAELDLSPIYNPFAGIHREREAYCELEISPTVYYRVFENQDRAYPWAVQYWFFYFDNEWLTDHAGDWESITVFLDEDRNPVETAFSTHYEANRHGWEYPVVHPRFPGDVEVFPGTDRPVVYVSNGGHGSYAHAGTTWYGAAADNHEGDWSVITEIDLVALPVDERRRSWLYFEGPWGQSQIFSSPLGPRLRSDAPTQSLWDLTVNKPRSSDCGERLGALLYGVDEQGPWHWASGYRTNAAPADDCVSAASEILPRLGATTSAEPTLQWIGVAGAVAYEVRIRDGDGVVVSSQRLEAEAVCEQEVCTWTTDQMLDPGVSYRWWVRPSAGGTLGAWLGALLGPWSEGADFSVALTTDQDGDGVPDAADNCPGLPNTQQSDFDGDGHGDVCDPDDDGDGVPDVADDFPLDPSEQSDRDGDGVGNNADPDDDGDGLPDESDPYPLNPNPRPVRGDLDADGDTDLLFRDPSNGRWPHFSSEDLFFAQSAELALFRSPNLHFQDFVDGDGDGDSDILARDTATGAWTLFLIEGGAVIGNVNPGLFTNQAWSYQTNGDYDGDGDDDVVLRHGSTGAWRLFHIEQGVAMAVSNLAMFRPSQWQTVGSGDFDADGDDDVLIRHVDTGAWRLFVMHQGAWTLVENLAGVFHDLSWQFRGLADMDGDGDADVLVRHGDAHAWRLFEIEGRVSAGVSNPFQLDNELLELQLVGDFDADGDDDALMRFTTTGSWRVFEMQANNRVDLVNPGLANGLDYTIRSAVSP